METPNTNPPSTPTPNKTSNPISRILLGMLIITVGVVLLLRLQGYDFPHWLFSWQMIIIVAGIALFFKEGFKKFGWMPVIATGVILLLNEYVEGFEIWRSWPIWIIVAGLVMILESNKKRSC
jgi:hypothetical protein